MSKSKGKLNEANIGWANIILSTGKPKIVKAELINKELMIFKLWTDHSSIKLFKDWTECKELKGWYYKEVLEKDIDKFIDNPFK